MTRATLPFPCLDNRPQSRNRTVDGTSHEVPSGLFKIFKPSYEASFRRKQESSAFSVRGHQVAGFLLSQE